MASLSGHLTQSRYYSTVFNAAVFDGPIRIYFAQHQEALALQVYHRMQQHLKETYADFRRNFRRHGQNIFLMLYPTVDAFDQIFGSTDAVVGERLSRDHVVGVRGPLPDEGYFEVFARVEFILQDLGVSPETPSP